MSSLLASKRFQTSEIKDLHRQKALSSETDLARSIPESSITQVDEQNFKVNHGDIDEIYEVYIAENTCSCDAFALFQFCMHLFRLKPGFNDKYFGIEIFSESNAPQQSNIANVQSEDQNPITM